MRASPTRSAQHLPKAPPFFSLLSVFAFYIVRNYEAYAFIRPMGEQEES